MAVLYVDRLGLPPFSRRDLHVLGIAANHVTAVLENRSRFEALRRANADLVEARESLAELNRNLEGLVEERTAEIRRQADEIGRLAAAKDELLGIAAHDIRGPLTVIQGTSELLRLRLGELEEETLGRSLEMIHGACRGLTRLLGRAARRQGHRVGQDHAPQAPLPGPPAARGRPAGGAARRRGQERPAGGRVGRPPDPRRRSRTSRSGDHQPGVERGQVLAFGHPHRAARGLHRSETGRRSRSRTRGSASPRRSSRGSSALSSRARRGGSSAAAASG